MSTQRKNQNDSKATKVTFKVVTVLIVVCFLLILTGCVNAPRYSWVNVSFTDQQPREIVYTKPAVPANFAGPITPNNCPIYTMPPFEKIPSTPIAEISLVAPSDYKRKSEILLKYANELRNLISTARKKHTLIYSNYLDECKKAVQATGKPDPKAEGKLDMLIIKAVEDKTPQ